MFALHLKHFKFIVFLSSLLYCITALASPQGIYINAATANNTKYLNQLIQKSKQVGINTFVIDAKNMGDTYARNVAKVKSSGIKYVARVVVFPLGGTPAQVKNKAYWAKINKSVQRAVALGADEIQLDYIRYNTKQRPSSQNAKDVLEVIKYFKSQINVPLQIAVFGETSFGPSTRIGQNIKLYSGVIDRLCPMTYPSHYEPFRQHAKTPYKTVYKSLQGIKRQYKQNVPFKVTTYIELSNYRYKLSHEQRKDYIRAQIKATEDANFEGWYAWSPNNYYDILFETLGAKGLASQ